MAAKRTPERAAQVLDRAARMSSFRAGWLDKKLGDPQMRTPGKVAPPFSIYSLPENAWKEVGVAEVPLKSIRTEQPTVSIAKVKAKLSNPGPADYIPKVLKHGDTYYTMDGNHRLTSQRALGETMTKARVYHLDGSIKPPLMSPKMISTGMRGATMAAGPVAVGSIAAMAYKNRIDAGGSTGEAALDATVAGGRTAATGLAIGSGIKIARASAMPALRSAASFASRAILPASIIGHAAAYGFAAWQRGESGGDIAKAAGWGAVNGVLPIDLAREAIGGMTNAGAGRVPEAAQFNAANKSYQTARAAAQEPDQGGDGKRKGWSDAARINSAKARGAAVLPYGGDPRQ